MRKEKLIERISKAIHNKDPKAEIFLFGSRSRGDNRKNSDWDNTLSYSPLYKNVSREGIKI